MAHHSTRPGAFRWSTQVALDNGAANLWLLAQCLGMSTRAAFDLLRKSRLPYQVAVMPRHKLYPHLRVPRPGGRPYVRKALFMSWKTVELLANWRDEQRLRAFAATHPTIGSHTAYIFLMAHLQKQPGRDLISKRLARSRCWREMSISMAAAWRNSSMPETSSSSASGRTASTDRPTT